MNGRIGWVAYTCSRRGEGPPVVIASKILKPSSGGTPVSNRHTHCHAVSSVCVRVSVCICMYACVCACARAPAGCAVLPTFCKVASNSRNPSHVTDGRKPIHQRKQPIVARAAGSSGNDSACSEGIDPSAPFPAKRARTRAHERETDREREGERERERIAAGEFASHSGAMQFPNQHIYNFQCINE